MYDYRAMDVAHMDIKLVEIKKNNVELPFSMAIHDFSTAGYYPLFTGLFADSTWGLAGSDHDFLQCLWKRLNMPQDNPDLVAMLKKHTEECFPQPGILPTVEPIVYRLTLEELIQKLDRHSKGMDIDQ